MKKVRFTIPCFIREKIKEDEQYFNLLPGEIGNKIFSYYSNRDVENLEIGSGKGKIIQFNLNKLNSELYYNVLKEHHVENEAEFFRNIFFKYLSNPIYMREKILFFENLKKLELALKERKKVNIKYKKKIQTINPYLIKIEPTEGRMYVLSYCEQNTAYKRYRISDIEKIVL
ncbi:MAG: WYL domain-containing protein [Cetobacterium sp.]|uniref:WYL domain-containing protein n=1 Tax=Cetobacterium sp. TaxID=2071632 RepID=UPI003EE6FBFC